MAGWSVTSLGLLALLAAASVTLMVRAAPRWGSHRGRPAALALLLLALGAFVNDYFGFLPQVGDIAGPRPWPVVSARYVLGGSPQLGWLVRPQGAVMTLPVKGTRSRTPAGSALVYLPPEYFSEPAVRFPVLYMLHGSPGVPLDWFRGGEAAEAGYASALHGRPTILVAPRMSRGWLDDSECVDRPGFAAESYLTLDVIPTIDAVLHTRTAKEARGVMGNSSGGYCALALGLRHPDLFARIVALSPSTTPTFSYGSLAELFGRPPELRRVVEQHTPAWLLLNCPSSRALALRLDIGRQDRLIDEVRQLAALDRALNGDPQVIVRQGGHTFRTWRPAIQEAVAWFAQGAAEPVAQPSAAEGNGEPTGTEHSRLLRACPSLPTDPGRLAARDQGGEARPDTIRGWSALPPEPGRQVPPLTAWVHHALATNRALPLPKWMPATSTRLPAGKPLRTPTARGHLGLLTP